MPIGHRPKRARKAPNNTWAGVRVKTKTKIHLEAEAQRLGMTHDQLVASLLMVRNGEYYREQHLRVALDQIDALYTNDEEAARFFKQVRIVVKKTNYDVATEALLAANTDPMPSEEDHAEILREHLRKISGVVE